MGIITTARQKLADLIRPVPESPPRNPVRQKAMAHAMKRGAMVFGGKTYQGGDVGRLMDDWLISHTSGDSAISAAWDMLTRRARDLVRNEPWAAQAIRKIVENVVGSTGIEAEAEVEFDDETPDDETNRELDDSCKRWEEEADSEGQLEWAEMQALALSEAVEVGDTFLVRVNDPDPARTIPLCWQLMEAEQLCTWHDTPGYAPRMAGAGQNRIKRGIEFDKFNRPIAYYFWVNHPYDLQIISTDIVRVPAGRVIHFFAKRRPSMTRGITWFAPILQALRDLSQYTGDEMTAARVAAQFTVAIKRAAGAGSGVSFEDGTDSTDDNGNPLEHLGPGIIADIGPEDSIEQINPNRPNANAKPWLEMMLGSLANGIGLTYLGLTGDVAKASFSSARFARLHDKTFWRTIQGRYGRRVVLRSRREVVSQLIGYGRIASITPTMFLSNPHRWLSTRLLPPGWEDIQSDVEAQAAITRIQAGLSTLQEECAGRGRNWRRILKQRAREVSLAQELLGPLGVTLASDQPPPGSPQTPQPNAPSDQSQPAPPDDEGDF